MTNISFLIGNGESRKDIDLETLRGKGTIIGCNALYRDFAPDVLLAVDQKMINEVIAKGYTKDNYVVIPKNRHAKLNNARLKQNAYTLGLDKYNTCGGAAMQYAGQMKTDIAYLLGYDCYGGNVYFGTENYARNVKDSRYNVFVKLFAHAFQLHSSTKFINVIKDGKDGITPRLIHHHKNFGTLDINEFITNLPKFPHQEPVYAHDEFNKQD